MGNDYLAVVSKNYYPDPEENILQSLFQQYEKVIVESIVAAFGLDFIIQDKYGGDVDTIYNVRQIGKNEKISYKSASNAAAYEKHLAYDKYCKKIKVQYDADERFVSKNRKVKEEKLAGTLKDEYTRKVVSFQEKIDIDHVISTMEIHEDRARILAGLDGISLANSDENLQPTDRSINRSMKEKSIDEYVKWLKEKEPERMNRIHQLEQKERLSDQESKELYKLQKQNEIDIDSMKNIDYRARKAYEAKLTTAYYTSPQFAKDVTKAAGAVGVKMGVRQALGFVFAEIWFAVKEELQSAKSDLKDLLLAIGEGVKRGVERAKEKYKDLLARFKEGLAAGVLSSLTTTLCNIFFTTAKNVVKIIRQTWASVVQAAKILLFNPDNLPFGERMRAAVKIIATGASIVFGSIVSEMISKTPIGALPIVGDIVPTFCGAFVSGIMSCTLLYFLDHSKIINQLVSMLNGIPSVEATIDYFRKQADMLERYAAALFKIDIDKFKRETAQYASIASRIDHIEDEDELNKLLKEVYVIAGIRIPWKDGLSFDEVMRQNEEALVFS